MKNRILIAVLLTMVAAISASNSYAITIDLWNSFPNSQGESGFYAYGYSYNGYRLLTDAGEHAFNTPEQSAKWNLPVVSQLSTYWIQLHPTGTYQCAYYFPPEDAVLGWLVPQSGSIDLSGMFWDEGNGGGIAVFIKKNSSFLWSDYAFYNQTKTFDLDDIQVNKNDMIYFHVNSGAGGDVSDWGRLKGQIDFSPVPEPATMVLFGIGSAAMIMIRRKKKLS